MIDPDYIAATIIAAIFTVLLAVCAVGAWLDGARGPAIFAALAMALPIGVWMLATWPAFDLTHHRYSPTTGTVTAIDHEDDGWYFIRLDGDSRLLECSDNRCGLIATGDEIELSCLRDNDSAGADRYRCDFTAITSTTS